MIKKIEIIRDIPKAELLWEQLWRQWRDGKINGNGVRYHSNGDVYSGHYLNSIRDETGKYIIKFHQVSDEYGIWEGGSWYEKNTCNRL